MGVEGVMWAEQDRATACGANACWSTVRGAPPRPPTHLAEGVVYDLCKEAPGLDGVDAAPRHLDVVVGILRMVERAGRRAEGRGEVGRVG